ncbi:putative polyprotein [Panicum miliaceum]|uniref:Polyprotein n=1 Tax=Panicum miliaceum TaxID=4540 RepID=A0A3L6RQU8_PANMI|nr:putative polyprotein [Panicum miliaceum]
MAFTEVVTNKRLVGKLETRNIETVFELFIFEDKCAREAEAWHCSKQRGISEEPTSQEHAQSNRPDNKRNKWKATAVQAAEGRNKQHPGRVPGGGAPRPGGGFQKPAPAKQGTDKWCEIHETDRHDLTECRLVKGLTENHQKERDNRRPDGDSDNAPEEVGLDFKEPQEFVATAFGGATTPPSRRRAELLWKEVCAASPAPESSRLIKWSGTLITFDWNDHPNNMAGFTLLCVVVTPTICNIGVARLLVDGGAGLNLLSPEGFHKMQIGERRLRLLKPFYGITEGKTVPEKK